MTWSRSPEVRVSLPRSGGRSVDDVRALHFDIDHASWRALVEWFTSPYWFMSSSLVDLLEQSEQGVPFDHPRRGPLAETDLSTVIGTIAALEVEGEVDALVDRYVFDGPDIEGAVALSDEIRRHRPDAVMIETTSGDLVPASVAAVMAWIVSESLLRGFPGEVLHGHRSLLRRVVPDHSGEPGPPALLLPLSALLPLPAGLVARSRARGLPIGVPLAVYPLAAMVLPEHSPHMFPVDEELWSLLDDASVGDRRGRLVPLDRWAMLRFRTAAVLSRPLARPVRVAVGAVARSLGWVVEHITQTGIGRGMVDRGVNVEWVWSLLRRGSSVADNPWMTRSARLRLDRNRPVRRRR